MEKLQNVAEKNMGTSANVAREGLALLSCEELLLLHRFQSWDKLLSVSQKSVKLVSQKSVKKCKQVSQKEVRLLHRFQSQTFVGVPKKCPKKV